jgi:hypothetical protein
MPRAGRLLRKRHDIVFARTQRRQSPQYSDCTWYSYLFRCFINVFGHPATCNDVIQSIIEYADCTLFSVEKKFAKCDSNKAAEALCYTYFLASSITFSANNRLH